MVTLAERHDRTAAQILLRWNLELGNAVISKSVTPERIRSNMEIFDFELTSEDHTTLATLNTGTRTGGPRSLRSVNAATHAQEAAVGHLPADGGLSQLGKLGADRG